VPDDARLMPMATGDFEVGLQLTVDREFED
jgi:hypothetical protein